MPGGTGLKTALNYATESGETESAVKLAGQTTRRGGGILR